MTDHRRHTLELMAGALILSFAPICVKLVHSGRRLPLSTACCSAA